MLKTGLSISHFRTHVPIIEHETRDYFERWGLDGKNSKPLSEFGVLNFPFFVCYVCSVSMNFFFVISLISLH